MLSRSQKAVEHSDLLELENVQKTSSYCCMCIHSLNAKKSMAGPPHNRFQNGMGLENRKMSEKYKEGRKMPPNTGTIGGPGSFSLGRRWMKKDVKEFFKTYVHVHLWATCCKKDKNLLRKGLWCKERLRAGAAQPREGTGVSYPCVQTAMGKEWRGGSDCSP